MLSQKPLESQQLFQSYIKNDSCIEEIALSRACFSLSNLFRHIVRMKMFVVGGEGCKLMRLYAGLRRPSSGWCMCGRSWAYPS